MAHYYHNTLNMSYGNWVAREASLRDISQSNLEKMVDVEPVRVNSPSFFIPFLTTRNMYNSEVETPRNDGSVGVYLKYTPDSGFEAVSTQKSGLFINGDVKDMEFITLNNTDYIISAKNDDLIEFTKIK